MSEWVSEWTSEQQWMWVEKYFECDDIACASFISFVFCIKMLNKQHIFDAAHTYLIEDKNKRECGAKFWETATTGYGAKGKAKPNDCQ